MKQLQTLDLLRPGEKATIAENRTEGRLRHRLLELGLTAGAPVECVGKSPFGDPCSYLIRGAVIALRKKDCREIPIRHKNTGAAPWD